MDSPAHRRNRRRHVGSAERRRSRDQDIGAVFCGYLRRFLADTPIDLDVEIQAPLFIKNGERLKVDTREGKYMERVNK